METREKEGSSISNEPPGASASKDPLLLAIIGAAIGLTAVVGVLFMLSPEGQRELGFFIPTVYSVASLTSLAIGFLAIARFRVLPDPPSFWIAFGFFSFGLLGIFFVLTFPGVYGEFGILTRSPNISAWFGAVQTVFLAVSLILASAASVPSPGTPARDRWIRGLATAMLVLTIVGLLALGLEERLPVLLMNARFGPFLSGIAMGLLVTFVAGALVSVRRYLVSSDTLLGYIAITQVAFAFALITASDLTRFSPLWYGSRLLAMAGLVVTLFGLLSEYVTLYRRERDARAGAQKEAQQSRAIIESMTDAVFVADSGGRITLLNNVGRRLLGLESAGGAQLSADELRARLDMRRLDGSALSPGDTPLARALDGTVTEMEDFVIVEARTGREIVIRTSAAPICSDEGLLGAVAVAKDVTELVQLDRMKDDFIRVAAHELKTPVTIMKGYAQAFPSVVDARPDQRGRMLSAIDEGADRITALVQDMLDISLLQSGRLTLVQEVVDLAQLVRDVLERMAHEAPRHELKALRVDAAIVRGDSERLEQVLTHHVENALKFSPDGGPIEVSLKTHGREAIVCVRDYGAGIPKDKQARVYQRFYRAHTDTPFDYGGLGVGLYISKQIVQAHAGRVWFESEAGEGSTFCFSLPLEAARGEA